MTIDTAKPSEATHTLILTPGLWLAEGQWYDECDRGLPVQGLTRIDHRRHGWEMFSELKVVDSARMVRNHYLIRPATDRNPVMQWKSENGRLGSLTGTFTVVDEVIVSLFGNRRSGIRGSECLRRVSEDHYLDHGVLFDREAKISSWRIELRRQAG